MNGSGKLTEPNLWALRNHRNIFHPQRRAALGHDDCLGDVLRTVDQSDSAHVDLLQTLFDEASSGIAVVAGKLLLDLSQAQAVGNQFVRVNSNLVFTRRTAEAGDINNVRYLFEILFDDPVFNGLQFHGVIGRISAV